MNRRRPKPSPMALDTAIAHLERDRQIAENNAAVARATRRPDEATELERRDDELSWVIDLLRWRRATDNAAMNRLIAKADADALADALAEDAVK